jgi:hypothetical protein
MKFLKAKLSTLLSAADLVKVAGAQMKRFEPMPLTPGMLAVVLESKDAHGRHCCYFQDEEVVVSPDGFAEITSVTGTAAGERKVVKFLMTRPIGPSDIA